MTRCDVAIVGGGPAGSTCARMLRDAGLSVAVIDKRQFPRDKTCAGWITPPVVELLELDPDDYRRHRVMQEITGFRTGVIGGVPAEVSYGRTVSYGIRRCEFDEYLLRRCGAELILDTPVRSLERTDDGWQINGTISARLLVGAGGHFCPVARQLGARENPTASVVAAQEIEYLPGPDEQTRIRGEVPELYFCNDLQGYGWCFRKGDWLNIGLGRLDSSSVSSHVAAFCDELVAGGRISAVPAGRFHGHAYQLYERVIPRLTDDRVLLIGDSAGLAYPQSGEGIRPAVESGTLAAGVICQADGNYSAASLTEYERLLLARFGKPRKRTAADWLPAGWLHAAARRLLGTEWFARRVVLDRWFLHRDVPPLRPAVTVSSARAS